MNAKIRRLDAAARRNAIIDKTTIASREETIASHEETISTLQATISTLQATITALQGSGGSGSSGGDPVFGDPPPPK